MLLVWVLSLFSWKVWQEVYPSYWFFFLFSKNQLLEMPAWLSWLSICLRLSSWSQGPGIESRIRLLAQQGACFSLYLLLSLSSAPPACALSLSLMNKYIKSLQSKFFYFLFFLKILFIYLTERDSQWEREHKQGEWERKKQAHSRGAWRGARSHNAGITPWAKGRRPTAVPPRRPYLNFNQSLSHIYFLSRFLFQKLTTFF